MQTVWKSMLWGTAQRKPATEPAARPLNKKDNITFKGFKTSVAAIAAKEVYFVLRKLFLEP